MGKYVLIGITKSGKSTLGQRVAKKLGMPFQKVEELAYDRLRSSLRSPTDLFLKRGADKLMTLQRDVLAELAEDGEDAIIEVWPELVLIPETAELLKKCGTVIYISRSLECLIGFANKNKGECVLMETNTGRETNLVELSVREYAKEIDKFEALADLTLENDASEDEGVERLADMITERKKQR